jgi:hypothetical protein
LRVLQKGGKCFVVLGDDDWLVSMVVVLIAMLYSRDDRIVVHMLDGFSGSPAGLFEAAYIGQARMGLEISGQEGAQGLLERKSQRSRMESEPRDFFLFFFVGDRRF